MIHTLTIPFWRPTLKNAYEGRHWSVKHRMKMADQQIVWLYAQQQRIPAATTRRRVTPVYTLGKGMRTFDPDAPLKSLLDALVAAGLLVDDSAKWCETMPPRFERGEWQTQIILEDLES